MFDLLTEESQQGLLLKGKAMAQGTHSQISQTSDFSHREVSRLRVCQYLEGMLAALMNPGGPTPLTRAAALELNPVMTMDPISLTKSKIQGRWGNGYLSVTFPMQERRLAYIVYSIFSEWMKLPLGEFYLLYTPQSGVQLLIY